MAHSLTRRTLTLFAGLALLASAVACGGGGTVPSSGLGSTSAAGPAKVASKANADDGATTATTYQIIAPLALTVSGTEIDFLTTLVALPTLFRPQADVTASTNELDIPMACTAIQTPVPVGAAGERRSAEAVSPSPPPTPQPTGLPVSNCVIVVYSNGVTTQVTGPALVDGGNLDFPATSPGLTYAGGSTYVFYVAIASGGGPTDNCANKTDNGNHYGNDDTRNQQDNGNHKDCGYHTGEAPGQP